MAFKWLMFSACCINIICNGAQDQKKQVPITKLAQFVELQTRAERYNYYADEFNFTRKATATLTALVCLGTFYFSTEPQNYIPTMLIPAAWSAWEHNRHFWEQKFKNKIITHCAQQFSNKELKNLDAMSSERYNGKSLNLSLRFITEVQKRKRLI